MSSFHLQGRSRQESGAQLGRPKVNPDICKVRSGRARCLGLFESEPEHLGLSNWKHISEVSKGLSDMSGSELGCGDDGSLAELAMVSAPSHNGA